MRASIDAEVDDVARDGLVIADPGAVRICPKDASVDVLDPRFDQLAEGTKCEVGLFRPIGEREHRLAGATRSG